VKAAHADVGFRGHAPIIIGTTGTVGNFGTPAAKRPGGATGATRPAAAKNPGFSAAARCSEGPEEHTLGKETENAEDANRLARAS
jgi:hypothetical protein